MLIIWTAEAMRNESLWNVQGVERVVFDTTQELPLDMIGV